MTASERNFAEEAEALHGAAASLRYAWGTTEADERAEAIELGHGEQFEWYREGYLAAASELDGLATLLEHHAAGVLKTEHVNGL